MLINSWKHPFKTCMTIGFSYFCLTKIISMKRLSVITFLLMFLTASLAWSQSRKKSFLYIDEQPVEKEEIVRLYKKNLDVITDDKQKDLDNYLDLYITYKLKLAEARELGLDKDTEYLEEISTYRKETTLSYLEESNITETILEDLYQRSKKEVHVSHILINLPAYSYGKDTIKAYEKIKALRERAISGEDFNQLAVENSDDPSAEGSKGDLGFFSTMQMVMPFEEAAYTTPINEISPIIRSNFGYHILKVHGERPAENKLRAAHIMVMKSKDSLTGDKRIQEAYEALQGGKSFSDVVKEYSQDEATKNKGGELEPFGRSDIRLKVFTDNAYSLQEGAYSKPFESDIGWHIVKLIERLPHPTKDEKLEEITKFLSTGRGNRYYDQRIYNRLLAKLEYNLLANAYIEDLLLEIDRKYLMSKVEPIALSKEKNKKMFTLDGQSFYYNDFLEYLSDKVQSATRGMRTPQILENAFEKYRNEKALDSYSNKLYEENQEYAASLDEYNNGVLLFNLMQKQVWGKAANDTIAHKMYYNKNKKEFDLPERWEVAVYSTNDKIKAKAIHEKLESSVEEEEVRKEFNIVPTIEIWSKASDEVRIAYFKSGQSVVLIQEGQTYQVVKLQKHMPYEERDFTTARNDVVQAYSKAFETQWLSNLREKYKVKLNKRKWRKLKASLL